MSSINIDWDNESENFDLECPDTEHHDRFGTNWETEQESTIDLNGNPCEPYNGCEICEDDSGLLHPIMMFGYMLDFSDTISNETLKKVAIEAKCYVIRNNQTEDLFIVPIGGGMDWMPYVAYAYVLTQKWLPNDMLETLSSYACGCLGQTRFEVLRAAMDEQIKMTLDRLTKAHKLWKKA